MDTAKAIRITFSAFILLAIFISVPSPSALTGDAGTPEFAAKIGQGNLALLRFDAPQGVGEITGKLREREMAFFKNPEENSFYSLVSAPLGMAEGIHLIELKASRNSANNKRLFYPVIIEETEFPGENIRVPKKMVDYDRKTLKRIKQERELVMSVTGKRSSEKLWKSEFLLPLDNAITSGFGTKRTLNGKKPYRHAGLDLKAKVGNPITASNSGRVVLAKSLYLGGNAVIIEHGLGLFTAYYHLSKIKVSEGFIVSKGDVVGLSGKTGRATGPHLHWGVALDGEWLNPLSVLTINDAGETHGGITLANAL
ncbi:MAG TPA: M23 family metallopeptidase [Thermodesulfobacteriota bacterium]|nr:M23 family metallopeptidase [Thermodesulfobacteriota bacterium]